MFVRKGTFHDSVLPSVELTYQDWKGILYRYLPRLGHVPAFSYLTQYKFVETY